MLLNKIMTIKGEINPEKLGVTYPHIHLYTYPPEWLRKKDPDQCLDSTEKSVAELKEFEKAGGRSVVEMTPSGYGRNIKALEEISNQVNANIIVTTGCHKSLFYEPEVYTSSEKELADIFIKEIIDGIEGTGIKAGVIKVGTSYNVIKPEEKKVIRAAAKAHLATGAPISTHTEIGTKGLEQLEILLSEKVEPSSIIIAHVDRNPDLYYHKAILQEGAFVIFDGLGKIKYFPESVRIELLIKLVKMGFQDKIMLSVDYGRKSDLKAYGGGPGLSYILRKFVPRLKEELKAEKLDADSIIDDFLVENPARALAFKEISTEK